MRPKIISSRWEVSQVKLNLMFVKHRLHFFKYNMWNVIYELYLGISYLFVCLNNHNFFNIHTIQLLAIILYVIQRYSSNFEILKKANPDSYLRMKTWELFKNEICWATKYQSYIYISLNFMKKLISHLFQTFLLEKCNPQNYSKYFFVMKISGEILNMNPIGFFFK